MMQMAAVELRTGNIRPSRREDYSTKCAGAAVGGECPLWRSFLDQVTAGDKDLQAYLQRVAGYCMTGVTTEHVMFFLYGTGANGKSVFINTLVGAWGDYAVIAPMETFIESHNDHHPTDLAGLRGARLVVAQETEQGRRWAEAKIKTLTGGDSIRARFMRQDFFTYTPHFKLMIAGNHRPSLSSVDEAIRRRIHLIPFTVTIPSDQRDRDLADKLREEWAGILQWAVDGCLEWQRTSLNPPAAVLDATADYIADEDSFARWIEDCCLTGRQHWGIGTRLWDSWRNWAERSNERTGSRKAFAELMKNHGFMPSKSQHVRGYDGIDLTQQSDGDRVDLR
jgi:putative DNA primase/helicase